MSKSIDTQFDHDAYNIAVEDAVRFLSTGKAAPRARSLRADAVVEVRRRETVKCRTADGQSIPMPFGSTVYLATLDHIRATRELTGLFTATTVIYDRNGEVRLFGIDGRIEDVLGIVTAYGISVVPEDDWALEN